MRAIWILVLAIWVAGFAVYKIQAAEDERRRAMEDVGRLRQHFWGENLALRERLDEEAQAQRRLIDQNREQWLEEQRQQAQRRSAYVTRRDYEEPVRMTWQNEATAAEWLEAHAPEQGWDLIVPVSEATPERLVRLINRAQERSGRLHGRGNLAAFMRQGVTEQLLPHGKVVVRDESGLIHLLDENEVETALERGGVDELVNPWRNRRAQPQQAQAPQNPAE